MTTKETTKSSSKLSSKLSLHEVKELIDYAIDRQLVVFQWDGLTIQPSPQYKDVPLDKSVLQSKYKDVAEMTEDDMLMWHVQK